jgi:seryl-tRNA(Sec) selenium transferase
MRRAWQIIGRGEDIIIVNETQAAVFTMGDDTQSRHEKKVGWKTIGQHIQEGGAKLAKRMKAAGDKVLKKLGAT